MSDTLNEDDADLAAHVQVWQERKRDRTYYAEHILPLVYRRFAPTAAAYRLRVRGLILVGSGQADTAALLIAALNPERIAFLLTSTTRSFRTEVYDRVVRLLGSDSFRCPFEHWLPHDDAPDRPDDGEYQDLHSDHSTVLHTYRGLHGVLNAWGDLPHSALAIDLTGGKSTMTVGLAKSAHVLGIQSVYVDSDYDERNQVIQGTQRLALTEDPLIVFGDLAAQEAARMFNAHNYPGAAGAYADLADRVSAPDADAYRAFQQLAEAYAAWESFDIKTARNRLEMLTNAQLPERLEPEHARLAQQAAALARLSSVVGQAAGKDHKALETLKKIDNILPLLGSLHTNALRREEQSRYDTAALLRYRCLELISQHRLASHGVLTEQPDLDGLRQRVPSIDQDYRRVELELGLNPRGLPNRPHRGGTYGSLSLFNGYLLLAALADELVGGYPLNDIRFRSEARNKSILAHGYRLITRDEYERFAEVVHVMLDRLFGLLAQDRADWEAPYRFVSL